MTESLNIPDSPNATSNERLRAALRINGMCDAQIEGFMSTLLAPISKEDLAAIRRYNLSPEDTLPISDAELKSLATSSLSRNIEAQRIFKQNEDGDYIDLSDQM